MVGTNNLPGPGGLELDLDRRTVVVDSNQVELSRREFDLLHVLVEERGRVVPFEELAQRVWGHEVAITDQRFIYTTAWRLRRALENAGAPDVIDGVRGIGYAVFDDDSTMVSGIPPAMEAPARSADRVARPAIAVVDPQDPDLRLTMVNDAAVELTGYSADELAHLPEINQRLWDPQERAIIFETASRALNAGEALTSGRCLVRADGRRVRVELKFSRMDGPGQAPLLIAEAIRSEPAGLRSVDGARAHDAAATTSRGL